MFTKSYFILLFLTIILYHVNFVSARKRKSPEEYHQRKPSSKYDNPNFIRDRYHDEIWKPIMNGTWVNRFKKPYHPAWMDYCDPYHCNDYHKTACGLNRKTMRFKWFQSACHIALNNMCAKYRGALKYDVVDTKYCIRYVMFLRDGCPVVCPDTWDPVCAVRAIDDRVAMFTNTCAMDRANCVHDISMNDIIVHKWLGIHRGAISVSMLSWADGTEVGTATWELTKLYQKVDMEICESILQQIIVI